MFSFLLDLCVRAVKLLVFDYDEAPSTVTVHVFVWTQTGK